MNQNPYESPKAETAPPRTASVSPEVARFRLRIALIILLIPGLYNFYCFDASLQIGNRIPLWLLVFYRTVNAVGIQLLCVGVWFFGLPALKLATRLIFSVFNRQSELEDWYDALYIVVKRMPLFAILGAILWWDWVTNFYLSDNRIPIGLIIDAVLAHLLAASLYLPLFYRWYCIEREARRRISIQPPGDRRPTGTTP